MNNCISLFPTLDLDQARNIFEIKSPRFFYTDENDGKDYKLSSNEENGSIAFVDDQRFLWKTDTHNLKLKWSVKCKRPRTLYDVHSMNSIACENAKIGIALQWFSKTSQQRNTVPFGVISNIDSEQNFECECTFEKATFRGAIGLSVILYIKEAGIPTAEESHFANIPGFIVGQLSECEARVDGEGSEFPVFEIEDRKSPLWSVTYDIDSIETDSFYDSIEISINKAHPSYSKIDRNSSDFDSQMFIEVMSQALLVLFEELRFDGFDLINIVEDECDGDSVAAAILYFKDKLNWNFDSPITLSQTIRQSLEKSLRS